LITFGHAKGIKVLAGYGYENMGEVFSQGDAVIKIWAHNISDTLKKHGYDGLDLDLETGGTYPGITEQTQWTSVIKTLRDTFDTWTPTKGLLTASPVGFPYANQSSYFYPENLLQCNRISLQEYDKSGYWNHGTGYNSPIYFPDVTKIPWAGYDGGDDSSGIAKWLMMNNVAGYQSRVLFGVPFYGRVFWNVSQPNAQPNGNYSNGTSYDDILNHFLTASNSTRVYDSWSKVPYISNTDSVYGSWKGFWVTYDDTISMKAKVDYGVRQNLGGMMTFELGFGALTSPPIGHRKWELQEEVYNSLQNLSMIPPIGIKIRIKAVNQQALDVPNWTLQYNYIDADQVPTPAFGNIVVFVNKEGYLCIMFYDRTVKKIKFQ